MTDAVALNTELNTAAAHPDASRAGGPGGPERAIAHREQFMAELPAGYQPTLRLLAPLLTTLGTAAVAWLLAAEPLTWPHLLIVPAGYLFGGCVEYALHRFALHHPRGKFLYQAHISHHLAFVPGAMPIRTYQELCGILFPAWATLAVVVLTLPLGLVVGLAWDFNAALLWSVTAASYVMVYELVHTATHLPGAERGWLGGWARHHIRHHALESMAHKNFSITLPVIDKVMGTDF